MLSIVLHYSENNINIANATEYHERLHEEHNKVSGLLSSKTTDIYDYSKQNTVVSSNVSAGKLAISSKKDANITGSNVVADNDVSVKAGGNLNIGSAEQTSESEYRKSVKKSGVFAGGGLGFTIGKEKQKDQYANQNVEQVGSTVGSVKGNVNLDADKAANVKGSTVVAGKDINITGENISIENSNSVYNAQEKHEFKRTGLSVSVGGEAVNKVNEVVNHVERANQVNDKRLAALHGYKAVESVEKNIGMLKDAVKNPSQGLSLNVSVGSSQSRSESKSTTVVANGSNVKAAGDVKITSTEKDINIIGSNVEGKDVTLDAKENLDITASETTNKLEQDSKSSSSSVGVGFDLATGQVSSVTISGSKSKCEVDANSTSYNESTIKADKNLDFTSGKATNIKGGKLSGEKVTGNVGGDLNIESKQDKNSYEEKNSSAGFGIGMPVGDKDSANKIGIFGSAGKSDVDSKYESVTDQSGIYAGKEGFDINVEGNTDLKGGIISSEAEKEKNRISTGTLTYEDTQNKADYKAGSIGINVDTSKNAKKKDAGVTPNIGVGAKDNAESVTKATVSEGEIEIKDKGNQKQDINKLNRDTQNSLNKLGEIFDKNTIKEKQEFAGLFQEFAHDYIGGLTGKIDQDEKAALNTFVDGLISAWTNGNFLAGASGTALLESMQNELEKIKDPALKQIVTGMMGALAGELVGGDAQVGASSAVSTEKYNHLNHTPDNDEYGEFKEKLNRAENLMQVKNIYVDGAEKSQKNEDAWFAVHENDLPDYYDNNGNAVYIPINVGVDLSGNAVYLFPGPAHNKIVVENIYIPSEMKQKIYNFNISDLSNGEFYSISSSFSHKGISIAVSLSVNQYGDIFQTIEAGLGRSLPVIDFSKMSKALSDSGASYTESYGVVMNKYKNVISDRYDLLNTMTGVGLNLNGNVLNSGFGGSLSSNGNFIMNKSSNISNDSFGISGTISVSSYVGRRK